MCCKKTIHGLLVPWPPKEAGKDKLFRVVYVIDVSASSDKKAAQEAHQIITDKESMKPVLQILQADGKVTTIDLAGKEVRQ